MEVPFLPLFDSLSPIPRNFVFDLVKLHEFGNHCLIDRVI